MDKKKERRKISNMDWGPIQTMEITSFLLKALNWKSHRSDKIQNYWFQAFLAAHLHITEYFNAIMEEPEKVPAWLTTEIIRQQGSQKLPPYSMLDEHVQDPNRNNSQQNIHTPEEHSLSPAEQTGCHLGSKGYKVQLMISKAMYEYCKSIKKN